MFEVQIWIVMGLKVGSVKDNGMIWVLVQGMCVFNGGCEMVMCFIDVVIGVVEVVFVVVDGIFNIMIEMKSKLVVVIDISFDEVSWCNLMGEYVVLGNEMNCLVEVVLFNGINILEVGVIDLSVVIGFLLGDMMIIVVEDMIDGGGIVDVVLIGMLFYLDMMYILIQFDQIMIDMFDILMMDVNVAVLCLGIFLCMLEVQKVLF